MEYIRATYFHDIPNLLNVAREHFPLVTYLFKETFKGKESMLQTLEDFAPGLSKRFDWQVIQAGQRVQIIKDGDLQMGTEIVISDDKSYATLLGASPGAFVSPEVMLRCLREFIPKIFKSPESQAALKEMFPVSDLEELIENADTYRNVRDQANATLKVGNV